MAERRNRIMRAFSAVWLFLMARRSGGSWFSRQRRWLTLLIGSGAVGGLILAGFADPASAAGLPSSVTLEQWADAGGTWITGDLGVNGTGASTYMEGEVVPFRLNVTDAGAGAFTFSVCRDFANGAVRGYLFLAPFNTSRAATVGATITSPATGVSQPFTGAATGGTVVINTVTEVGGQGACGAGQRETQVAITITGTPTVAYVLWGGHLASPTDPGVGAGNGASQYPGGSLSMQLLSPAKNKSIKTAAIIQPAQITVQKIVDSGSALPSQFCFNISPNPNAVALPLCPAAGQDSVTFLGLPTASYTVTEAPVAGYTFASGTGTNCTFSGSTATAAVAIGNTPTNATCIFHNRLQTGTLTVVKTVVNDNGGTRMATSFPLFVNGNSVTSGVASTLPAGTYTVSETGDPGYAGTIGGACASDGSVTLADGQNLTCTITNNDIAPTLTVIKHVINDNGGTAVAGDFTMNVTGTNVLPAASFPGSEAGTSVTLNAGSYSVGESGGPTGYTSSVSAGCTGNLPLAGSATCTITNNDVAPTLTVIKHVINDNGGTAVAGNFTMNVTGPNVAASFPGTEAGNVVTLPAGSYSVGESGGPSGYASSASSGCSGTLVPGGSATCTITNNDIAPTLTVIKHVINDNGGTAVASDFHMDVTGTNVKPDASFPGSEAGTAVTLDAGSYSVGESGGPTGYTASNSAGCTGILPLGGSATCTITNDDVAPTLTVIKHVINDNGGTAVAGDFTMNVTGTNFAASFPGSEAGNTVTFNAGSYSVGESGGPTGYSGMLSAGCSGTLAVGQTRTCTITNDDNPATLIVIKHVVNDNGGTAVAGEFTMNVTGANVMPAASFPGTEAGTVLGIDAGAYTVGESGGPAGYSSSLSSDCAGTIANGESKTCTITNDDQPGHLTVIKKVVNDNGGTAVPGDFTMTISGVTVTGGSSFPGADDPGVTRDVNAGTFNVTEAGPTGYNASLVGCAGSIGVGESKTCTIINDDQAASITVIKHVVNDNGGTATAGDFTMTINGVTATGGSSFPGAENPGVGRIVTPGSYNVTEAGPAGYAASFSTDCTGSIALGETKTCTVTNDDQAAHLTVIKHVINNNGGTAKAADFTMTINGITATGGNSFPGAESPGVTRAVTPGSYTVTESNGSGYTATLSAECAGTIALGQSKTCTITNDDQAKYGHNPGDTDPGNPYGGNPGDTTIPNVYVAPTTTTTTTTTTAPIVDPGTIVAGKTTPVEPAPNEQVLGGETERPAPAPAPLGGHLPRTGAAIAGEGMLALLLVGAGLALMRIARRRRSQPSA